MNNKDIPLEIKDFNESLRNVILINNDKLKLVKGMYEKLRTSKYSVMVFRYGFDLYLFNHMYEKYSREKAIGYLLGYPPKVVDWYVDAPNNVIYETGTVEYGSFTFKCPDFLLKYAKDYLTGPVDASTHTSYNRLLHILGKEDRPILYAKSIYNAEKVYTDHGIEYMPVLKDPNFNMSKYSRIPINKKIEQIEENK